MFKKDNRRRDIGDRRKWDKQNSTKTNNAVGMMKNIKWLNDEIINAYFSLLQKNDSIIIGLFKLTFLLLFAFYTSSPINKETKKELERLVIARTDTEL